MNDERQWWISRILYILAANYDQKHLENSKIRLENSWIFFFQKSGNPVEIGVVWGVSSLPRSLATLPFDRVHMTYYSTLIEIMRLSCTIFQ